VSEIDCVWCNGVTNTTILVDRVRRQFAKRLKRSKVGREFDAALDEMLQEWMDATRRANPQTYEECEEAFRSFTPSTTGDA